MGFEFRKATPADVPEIVSVVNSAYRGETGKQGWTTEAHILGGERTDAARVAALLTGQSTVLLAKEGDRLLGCVHLERQDSGVVYLGMLTVAVAGQMRGVGNQLLSAGEKFAHEEWKARAIEMTVIRQRSELISWYERRGYKITGERRPFPADTRFGVPLVDGIEFEVLTKAI